MLRSKNFHFIDDCIDESSFASASAADNENIFASSNSLTENVNVLIGSASRIDVERFS